MVALLVAVLKANICTARILRRKGQGDRRVKAFNNSGYTTTACTSSAAVTVSMYSSRSPTVPNP